jgi:hypothetical protein
MEEWSNIMHNCIRSYSGQAGYNAYVGIYKNGELIANAEITNDIISGNSNWTLRQLLGKYNQSLDDTIKNSIQSYFRTLGVDVPRKYWGAEVAQPIEAW